MDEAEIYRFSDYKNWQIKIIASITITSGSRTECVRRRSTSKIDLNDLSGWKKLKSPFLLLQMYTPIFNSYYYHHKMISSAIWSGFLQPAFEFMTIIKLMAKLFRDKPR